MDIELTRIFVKVIQNGSFSRAAELLKVPKSTVSKSISRLESMTGTKLMMRTTRSLTLTAAGRAYFESCVGPITTIEEAQKSLDGKDNILSGLIRMTAPEDLGAFIISKSIGELTKLYPQLDFELHYTDDIVDLIRDGFDLAIRIGKLSDTSLKAKRIGEINLVPVATAAYLAKTKKIKHPKDLEGHAILGFGQLATHWTFRSKNESVQMKFKARVSSNQMGGLINMALGDAGVALVPLYLVQDLIQKNELIRVLPEWERPGFLVSMISPATTSARLKVTKDYLYEAIRRVLATR